MFVEMLLNVVLAFVPTAVIAVKQTITIRASITAYSTAVGPSSETRKRRTFRVRDFIAIPPFRLATDARTCRKYKQDRDFVERAV
jgi:hypothetical protein